MSNPNTLHTRQNLKNCKIPNSQHDHSLFQMAAHGQKSPSRASHDTATLYSEPSILWSPKMSQYAGCKQEVAVHGRGF